MLDKQSMSERDICTKFITPAVKRAGWDEMTQIREEVSFTKGRIIVRGKMVSRGQAKRADYVLYYKPNIPLALIEAKDNSQPVGAGIQQGLEYAETLDIPFVFASNGDGFLFHDRTSTGDALETTLNLDAFPSPEELWQRYAAWKGLTPAAEEIVLEDYFDDGSGKAPRYYQVNAVNAAMEAIAKGQKRVLLVMATGTGKTYTSFQIIWRLWKGGHKKRILFLADRNVLVDQTMVNDFRPFGPAMAKLSASAKTIERDGGSTTTLADAPDAIARLRRFVLDLAVRGKLVEQDAAVEPASELLKRIATEKARLVKVGSVRDRAALPAVMPQDAPYSLPSSWIWVRFANIVEFYAGRTPARNDLSYWNTGDHAWVSIADMEDGGIIQQTKETVSDIARTSVFKSEPEPVGTMVMSFKLTIGKIARLGVPAFHNEAIISIHPHLQALDGYLFMALPELARAGDTKGAIKGATLNRDSLSNILVPLPPLAEQHRIVAKVDELMALCDQLEAARTEREAARDTFTLSTLAKLSTPDPETFRQDARFALANLAPLTTRPDQINQLRQTILNLAVRGKLVGQDAADEPAGVLLERTNGDIENYCSANRVARPKPDPLAEDAVPFSSPAGWAWVRLCQLFRVITDGDHQPPPRAEAGIAFLTIGNVTTGRLDFNNCRLVPDNYFRALPAYRTPAKGDILYTVVGATYGRPALVDSEREFCVQRHIAILKPAKTLVLHFLLLLLASPLVYDQATNSTTGTAQPTIALRPLRNFVVPVPPLAEQHRIVARVNELMALCDQLEASIITGEQTRSRLLDAVLHKALEPG